MNFKTFIFCIFAAIDLGLRENLSERNETKF